MIQLENEQLNSKELNHLGLVAGMCKELQIAETIDQLIPSGPDKKVSHGKLVEAMILNGLGFTSKALYLTTNFFKDKPVEKLLGSNITANDINDDALGRTLDALFKFNVTELYSHLAAKMIKNLNVTIRSAHLDSTSFHVHGEYNSKEEEPSKVHITNGYSRDHRPDLNQIMLNMITSSKGNIPLFMKPSSGNSSDKKEFGKILSEHISLLTNVVDVEYAVIDSGFYSSENLQSFSKEHYFISRVPVSISSCKDAIKTALSKVLIEIDDNYSYYEVEQNYGGIEQRWIVIKSIAAEKKEKLTSLKKIKNVTSEENKKFQQLCKKEFCCEHDAISEYELLIKTFKLCSVSNIKIIKHKHYNKKGKPKKTDMPSYITYSMSGNICTIIERTSNYTYKNGFFVLATNDLDKKRLSCSEILSEYKGQYKVERGFRFLKSPHFLTESFFVKKEERICSLLMVMTLCLAVYSALEYRIRQGLLLFSVFFLNQKGKKTQNPTAKWVFECFSNIQVLMINNTQEIILNLQEQQKKILQILGNIYLTIYSLNEKCEKFARGCGK